MKPIHTKEDLKELAESVSRGSYYFFVVCDGFFEELERNARAMTALGDAEAGRLILEFASKIQEISAANDRLVAHFTNVIKG